MNAADSDAMAVGLTRYKYRYRNEADLQERIAEVLAPLPFEREVRLGPGERIDFVVGPPEEPGLGIEVKIKGSRDAVVQQLTRYARHARIASLMLITTRLQLASVPRRIGGKPVLVQVLWA